MADIAKGLSDTINPDRRSGLVNLGAGTLTEIERLGGGFVSNTAGIN